jgi:hypothetical protein
MPQKGGQFANKNVDELDLSASAFDPEDFDKRPPGWKQIRLRRVKMLENFDRIEGVPESTILMMRPRRMVEVENQMLKETGVLEKVRIFEARIAKNQHTAKVVLPGNHSFYSQISNIKAEQVKLGKSAKEASTRASFRKSMSRRSSVAFGKR